MPSEPAGNLYINALIGAVATIVLAFLPFSPLLGGALAGYLERGDRERGMRTGAVSGLFASVPLALVGLVVLLFFPFALAFDGPALGISLFAAVVVLLVAAAIAAYTIGLSVLGGIVGVALVDEN